MTCLRTYCGLCIYSASITPEQISERLAIEPTRINVMDPDSRYRNRREHHFWSWSTYEKLESTDHIDHLNQIFKQLEGKSSVLDGLRNDGCKTTISCYWDSNGQGGPWLDLAQIKQLAEFGLDIWWDVYFVQSDESTGA